MTTELKKKLFPADLAWNILNNLHLFNDRSGLIVELSKRFSRLTSHSLFKMFIGLFEEAVNFYEIHKTFPDIKYLNKKFPDGKLIKILEGEPFSMDMYNDLIKRLDYELIIQDFDDKIARQQEMDVDAVMEMSKQMARFATANIDMSEDTKNDLINCYDNYSANFKGVSTGIAKLDEAVGVLGYRSLSVLAAPSGHGKTTTAITMAYNMAMSGMKVCYTSFEVAKELMWFNLISMESKLSKEHPNKEIPSYKMKESLLTEEEKVWFKEHMTNMLAKIKRAGGYIDLIDQTQAQCETFEQLCAMWEDRAERKDGPGGPADFIIVDNVDNLKVLHGSERDEAVRVNQYIIALDRFTRTYCNNVGTAMLLLTQVNRTGIKKMSSMEAAGDKEVSIDVTCIQQFNALYEKGSTVLVAYSGPTMRPLGKMNIMPVKLRNRGLPTRPIGLKVAFENSCILGDYEDKVNDIQDIEDDEIYTTAEDEEDFGAMVDDDD